MDNFKVIVTIYTYNCQYKDFILECECYEQFSTPNLFTDTIVNKKRHYKACYLSKSGYIRHQARFVLLGSYIDFRIRGEHQVAQDRNYWGSFVEGLDCPAAG